MSNRRSFIRSSLVSSLAITPAIKTLSEVFLVDEITLTTLVKYAYRLSIPDNLLNLDFYFINVRKSGNQVVFDKNGKAAFMIVRLPQQHIAEQSLNLAGLGGGCNFAEPDNAAINELLAEPVKTFISGYSYLAFRISVPSGRSSVSIPLTAEGLTDWNRDCFDLETESDWKSSLFEFTENQYPFGFIKNINGYQKYSYDLIPRRGTVPLTVVEAPWRLLMTPRAARQSKTKLQWKFSKETKRQGNVWESELWGATLFTVKDKNVTQPRVDAGSEENGLHKHFKGIELMLIGSPDYLDVNHKKYDDLFVENNPAKKIVSRHVLPAAKVYNTEKLTR